MGVNYTGYDAYKTLVDFNNKKYEGYGDYKFIHSDFRALGEREKIVPAELCILKDVVQHWPTADIIDFIDYLVESKKFKYILLINCFTGNPENNATHRTDIKPGEFSALSSKTYPLNKYNLEVIYTWDTKEVSLLTTKQFDDKKLSRHIKYSNLIKTNINYKKFFTGRLIINNKYSDYYNDLITLKQILEGIGGFIDIIFYDLLNNKQEYINTNVNIQIFFEHTFVINSKNIFPSDNSYIYINFENIVDWDLLNIKNNNVIPLCKTNFNLNILNNLNIKKSIYTNFGIKYNKELFKNTNKIPNLCFHNANNSLQGTKEIINIWINNKINENLIIIINNYNYINENLIAYINNLKYKSLNLPNLILNICPKEINLPLFKNLNSIYIYIYESNINTEYNNKIINFLESISDIHICPSIYNDNCNTIHKAILHKSLVITLNTNPFNTLINKESGLLVNIKKNISDLYLKDILHFDKVKYYPNNVLIKTNNFSSVQLYKNIINAFNINNIDKRIMTDLAFYNSQINYNIFYKNIKQIILNSINNINDINNELYFKCNNKLNYIYKTHNLNKINYYNNKLYKNNILLNKTTQIIIISEFIPDNNYLGTFVSEIFNIWLYIQSYFFNINININNINIVLKNYQNNEVNKLRLNFFKNLYKNVYIQSYNYEKKNKYKIITLKHGSRLLHFETLCTYYWWISNNPGYNPYLKTLITTIKKNMNIYDKPGTKIGYFYRQSSRFVYDIKDKDKLNNNKNKYFLHTILKNKLNNTNILFEEFNIENKSINEIAHFLKDKKILISPHWHDLAHLIFLPTNSTIIEITFSKHWYCDPICKDHLKGLIPYNKDCYNRKSIIDIGNNNSIVHPGFNLSNSELYYHKADYHNLSKMCCKNWVEFQLDYGKDYTLDNGNYNPIFINELYVDINKLLETINSFL